MSETDSFISEVTEEVRRERLFGFFRRWGWLIALLLVGAVAAAAGYEIQKARAQAAAEVRGDALRAALSAADPAARVKAIDALPPGPDAAAARFAAAGAALEAGDRTQAAAELAAAATDPAAPEPWKSLAALQRVMILGSDLPVSERLAVLDGLAAEGAPFRPLALEQRAFLRLEQGDRAQAAADFDAILKDPTAPQGLRARVEQLSLAVGGATPAAPVAPAAPAEGAAAPAEGAAAPGSGG